MSSVRDAGWWQIFLLQTWIFIITSSTIFAPYAGVQAETQLPLPRTQKRTLAETEAGSCAQQCEILIPFNSSKHKATYTVGVLSPNGLDVSYARHNTTFSDFLTATAGQRFDPPISFRMVGMDFRSVFSAVVDGTADFFYVNPSIFTCIEVEHGVKPIVSHISKRVVDGNEYELSKFGGVIIARSDDGTINTITDLKDKVVAAASISAFGAGQMQFREMINAGLSHINDPSQLVFTGTQSDIVNGVLSGDFDVGFVRTDQAERTRDAQGNRIDTSLLKTIHPVDNMLDGKPFPFEASTQLYPEWSLSAMGDMPADIAQEVQSAMFAMADHSRMAHAIEDCLAAAEADASSSPLAEAACKDLSALPASARSRCDTTYDIAMAAKRAMDDGGYAGFQTPLSYSEVRDMLHATRFMTQESIAGLWTCDKPSGLYDAIRCPKGFFVKSRERVDRGCLDAELTCKAGYECLCKPCLKAFDVDVSALLPATSQSESGLGLESKEPSLSTTSDGCPKMSVCGESQQTIPLTLQAVDNKNRTDAVVTVTVHEGEKSTQAIVTKISIPSHSKQARGQAVTDMPNALAIVDGSSGSSSSNNDISSNIHHFSVVSRHVGSLILEIFLDGEQISESPLRIQIIERDCSVDHSDKRHADTDGACVCDDDTIELFGTCVLFAILIPSIIGPICILLLAIMAWYVDKKRKEGDSVWAVKPEELLFADPPQVIGQGTFGFVLLAEYRGTQVAVKRVLTPRKEDMIRSSLSGPDHSDGGASERDANGTDSSDEVETVVASKQEHSQRCSVATNRMASVPSNMKRKTLKAGMFNTTSGMSSNVMVANTATSRIRTSTHINSAGEIRSHSNYATKSGGKFQHSIRAAPAATMPSTINEKDVETEDSEGELSPDLPIEEDLEANRINTTRSKTTRATSTTISATADGLSRTSRTVGRSSASTASMVVKPGKRSEKRTFEKHSQPIYSGLTSGLDSQLVVLPQGSNSGSAGNASKRRSNSKASENGSCRKLRSRYSMNKSNSNSFFSLSNGFLNMFRRDKRNGYSSSHSRQKDEFIEEMRLLSKLRHPCITTVMGAVIAKGQDPALVMEYMSHGSLYDLLHNGTMVMDGEMILNFLRDIASGVRFLHSADPLVIHGDLKSANVLVDSKFRAKVADFGFSHRKKKGAMGTPFFMAPELLRGESSNTAASDMYSLGIILYELYSRREPYEGEDALEVLQQVGDTKINRRPLMPPACPFKVSKLMKSLLAADPLLRPTAGEFDNRLKELTAGEVEPMLAGGVIMKRTGAGASAGMMSGGHVMDGAGTFPSNGMKSAPISMSSLATGAATAVSNDRAATAYHQQQQRQQQHGIKLLSQMFPLHIARIIERGGNPEPESHELVTIYFSDIVGFTSLAAALSDLKVSSMLNRLYHAFDDLAQKHDLFKIETIGDAYMCASNLAKKQPEDHVRRIAKFAADAAKAAGRIPVDEDDLSKGYIRIRGGFHTGPVVSNVVGTLNPRYGVFGDTVNVAARMESTSAAGRIQCSERSALLLMTQDPRIQVRLRGEVQIKGKGSMVTYWTN